MSAVEEMEEEMELNEDEGILLGIGNPLMNMIAYVDQDFLDKYDIELDSYILAEEEHLPMFKEMASDYVVKYEVGGATQNTIRTAEWVINIPYAVNYIGCIGKDNYGGKMKRTLASEKIGVHYCEDDSARTGTCAICIVDGEKMCRSVVANLSAASCFTSEHLQRLENWRLVEKARYYYIAGYFLVTSPECIMLVAEHAAANNKVFAMSLSAPFICGLFNEAQEVLPYVDYIFGNEAEARAFARVHGWETDNIEEIALNISEWPLAPGKRGRIAVITEGSVGRVVIANDGETETFPAMVRGELCDVNRAGNAFVGGFLGRLVLGKSFKACVVAGCYCVKVRMDRKQSEYKWIDLRNRPQGTLVCPPSLQVASPCLLVTHGEHMEKQSFYNFTGNNYWTVKIPEMKNKRVCSSCFGWWILEDLVSDEVSLFNPIKMQSIELPPMDLGGAQLALLSAPPTDDECHILFVNTDTGEIMCCQIDDENFTHQTMTDNEILEAVTLYRGGLLGLIMPYYKLVHITFADRRLQFGVIPVRFGNRPDQINVPVGGRFTRYLLESLGILFVERYTYHDEENYVDVWKFNYELTHWMKVQGIVGKPRYTDFLDSRIMGRAFLNQGVIGFNRLFHLIRILYLKENQELGAISRFGWNLLHQSHLPSIRTLICHHPEIRAQESICNFVMIR